LFNSSKKKCSEDQNGQPCQKSKGILFGMAKSRSKGGCGLNPEGQWGIGKKEKSKNSGKAQSKTRGFMPKSGFDR